GTGALFRNTTGFSNTATGFSALYKNTAGVSNTATGFQALYNNVQGNDSTAMGYQALFNADHGANTAMGVQALYNNTNGMFNTAVGIQALSSNTTGSYNVAVGSGAGTNLTTGSNNVDIDHPGFAGEHDTIRIGNIDHIATFIGGIYAVNEGSPALPVYVSSSGQLGTVPSSRRFKDAIKSMDEASEAILALKPVTFQYKSDKTNTPQFGLIAEQVAEVNPDLVVRDENGAIYTVRYDAVNAMLLSEFLKEHKRVQELNSAMAKQEAA